MGFQPADFAHRLLQRLGRLHPVVLLVGSAADVGVGQQDEMVWIGRRLRGPAEPGRQHAGPRGQAARQKTTPRQRRQMDWHFFSKSCHSERSEESWPNTHVFQILRCAQQ